MAEGRSVGIVRRGLVAATMSAAAGLGVGLAARPATAQTGTTLRAGDESFYEWRFYQIQQGRMDDMHARMRDDLLPLFARHAIPVAGAWQQGVSPSPRFVYLLKWASWAERLRGWAGFYADPEWLAVRARTNRGSDLVQRQALVMVRALGPLGPLRTWRDQSLLSVPVTIGRLPAVIEALPAIASAQAASGGALLGAFEHLFGEDVPRVSLLVGGRTPDLSSLDPLTDGPVSRSSLTPAPYPVATPSA